MARRSERLIAMGYYDDEGKPCVSYSGKIQRELKKKAWTDPIAPRKKVRSSGCPVPGLAWKKIRLWEITLLLFFVLVAFEASFYMCTLSMTYMHQRKMQTEGLNSETIWMLQEKVAQLKEELHQIKKQNLPEAQSMANFALDSLGAEVINDRSSKNHKPKHTMFERRPSWETNKQPGTVIGEKSLPLTPGRCWAFEGQRGHLFISLSHTIHISHVTLGHITKDQSPTGSITSAPKKFTIYGLKTLNGEEINLGSFNYSENGNSLQTFKLPDNTNESFRFVRLQIEDNHGHPSYTCMYNFRVHGRISVQP